MYCLSLIHISEPTRQAVHGYFQLALDKKSSRLTTFLIPQGRFRYLRAPMGLNASSDEWGRQSDIIAGVPYAMKIVDDTIILSRQKMNQT